MSSNSSIAFATMAATIIAVGVVYSAFAQQGGQRPDDDPVFFDLGIDVRTLPQDPAAAKKFVADMNDELARRVVIASCDNYIKNPVAAEMPETISFCKALLSQ